MKFIFMIFGSELILKAARFAGVLEMSLESEGVGTAYFKSLN